jgi:histidyl-tRNA synthetase
MQQAIQQRSFASTIDVMVLVEDEALRTESLALVQRLQESGKAVDYSLTPMKADKQFKRALQMGAAHWARLERGTEGVIVRVNDLRSRTEQVCPPDSAASLV